MLINKRYPSVPAGLSNVPDVKKMYSIAAFVFCTIHGHVRTFEKIIATYAIANK